MFKLSTSKARPIALILSLVLTLAGAAAAQCPPIGDDGFNVGCCALPMPVLPNPPQIQVDARYGCIRDCSLEAQFQNNVSIGFMWFLCDYALLSITVTPVSPGAPAITGVILAKYSRTWMETGISGVPVQVWRFLLNGDVQYGTVGAAPCPTPPEAVTGQLVHLVGHIDYICENVPGIFPWRVRLSLNHFNGCISHAPYSTFPLAGALAHNDRSYHLVAPSNFVFAPPPPLSGPIVAESIRSSVFGWAPFTYDCRGEQRVVQGQLQTVNNLCAGCPAPAGAAGIYSNQSLIGTAVCGPATTTFATLPIPGILPTGLLTLRLGSWVPTPVSPGGPDLYIHFGVLDHVDPCNGRGPVHVVTGVTTFDVNNPGMLFPDPVFPAPNLLAGFMDLQNVLILPIYPGHTLPLPPYPGWGSLFASDVVWNLNLP